MNQINKFLYFFISVLVFSSCTDLINPNLGGSNLAKYVVDGQITNQEGYQTVAVSMTSPLNDTEYSPLSFCEVKIIDNLGNEFMLVESPINKGHYSAWIAQEYLNPGNSYQVNIQTPSGVEIVSDFDQMSECPKIDSVYYILKDIPTTDPKKTFQGLQFYIDFVKESTNSNYYRWEIIESWEHHAVYPKTIYFNEKGKMVIGYPDYSRFYCWSTQSVSNIFTLSTENLPHTIFRMNPLHLVDNQTQRLTYCYSILVNQFAISKPAYKFWNNLRINNNEQGGLYSTQPLRIKGNLKSTTNPELEILGFFGAASVSSKRIFVQDVENLDVLLPDCIPPHLPNPPPAGEKYKYMIEIDGSYLVLKDECVECDVQGGTTVKPDFWPY
jgi:hypothetical protein